MSGTDGALINRSTRLRRRESLAADVGGEVVIMDVEKGLYFGLDTIASDVWSRLQTPVTVTELAQDLSRTYAADVDVIETDVIPLLREMVAQGLVEPV